MTGAHRACGAAHVVGAIGNVALNAIFIPLFGLNGAALATACIVVSVNLWLLFVIRRRLGLEPSLLQFSPTQRRSGLDRARK